MTNELEQSLSAIRVYNWEILSSLPKGFRRRVEKASLRFQGPGVQLMILLEKDLVKWSEHMRHIFIVDENKHYKESFHKNGENTYHVIITGLGSPEKLATIQADLGVGLKTAITISNEEAEKEGLPIRYHPRSK